MQETNSDIKSMSALNFLFGAWLIISPYLLSYSTGQAKWQQTIGGIIIAVFAAVRYFAPSQLWTSWVNAVVALWLIIAPFVTGYTSAAAHWNEVIFSILVIITAISNGATRSSGQHHRSSI